MEKSQYGNVQRVVAHPMFQSTKEPTQDNILMCSEGEENKNVSFEAIEACSAIQFCLLRICIETGDLSTEKNNISPDMSNSSSHIQTELCFVQIYEMFGTNMLAIDAVDKAPDCIRLRWHREDAENKRYLASKFFGIVPVKSIIGLVHLVPADGTFTLLDCREQSSKGCKTAGPTAEVKYST